ncbi:unnamed protein product [Lathyrus sativus]|nr:unnamed protein product [Lathyrus sativus]
MLKLQQRTCSPCSDICEAVSSVWSVPAQCLRRNQYLESSPVRLICKALKKVKIVYFCKFGPYWLRLCFQITSDGSGMMLRSRILCSHGTSISP